MSRDRASSGPAIGATLKDARRRVGMDVKEAEDRTKIRARYIRALEAEEWEVLPGPAYIRGFLRTYGQILGLDGEMLADEYRRRHEGAAPASPAGEPILRDSRRSGGRSAPSGPSRAPLVIVIAVVVVILLVILWILGNGGDEDTGGARDGRQAAANGKSGGKEGGNGKRAGGQAGKVVSASVEPLNGGATLCLVGGRDDALLDSQMLSEGARETFDGERRYRLDLPDGGVVRFEVGGESKRIVADPETTVEGDSSGIRETEYAGPDCP